MALTPLLAVAAIIFVGPEAKFTTEEAANCAAVHAITLDAMRKAENVPVPARKKIRDGLAVWEYEINASAPAFKNDAAAEKWKAATSKLYGAAENRIYEDLAASTQEGAAVARGDYLIKASVECQKMIKAAYGEAEHPVMPFLREADAKAGLPTVTPVATTAEAEAEPGRGLR